MKDYDFYFFDLFHTLVRLDPFEIPEKRECAVLDITQDEWNAFSEFDYERRATGGIRDPDEIIARILLNVDPGLTAAQIAEIGAVRKLRFKKAFSEVRPSILDALRRLRRRGKKLVLVSNADALDKLYWSESPLCECFNEAVFSCDVGAMKPDRKIYEIAMDRIGADASRSAFIGDGGHGELAGAKRIGMDAVLTTEIIGGLWPESIGTLSRDADFVIGSLEELAAKRR